MPWKGRYTDGIPFGFRYADDLVECFPGEFRSTWFSPKGLTPDPKKYSSAGVGTPKAPSASGKFWHQYNNRCRFREKYFKEEVKSRGVKICRSREGSQSSTQEEPDAPTTPTERRRQRESRKRASRKQTEQQRREQALISNLYPYIYI